MLVTNKISNFCNILNMGQRLRKRKIFLPKIKFYELLSRAFLREGLIKGFKFDQEDNKICVFLCYLDTGLPLIQGIFCEVLGKKYKYITLKELILLNSSNIFFLNTVKGLLSDSEAIKLKVGGQLVVRVVV